MFNIHSGQCGMCAHFGEHHPEEMPKLIQVRTRQKAPENLMEECGHPRHAPLHLMVTANSGCDGFLPLSQQQVGVA